MLSSESSGHTSDQARGQSCEKLTLRRRSGAFREVGAPTASMLAATLATEGDCTMPPKLMWPESPLCADSLHAQKLELSLHVTSYKLSTHMCSTSSKARQEQTA